MDGSKLPRFPPASEVPLHLNAPLAPSQELAYRNKCIQLKRRLQEIEANNDATRRRIAQEKERIQKMRLLRAILLDRIKEIMETPGKKLTPEQLHNIGIMTNGTGDVDAATRELGKDFMKGRPEGEVLLDDSSDDSEAEDIPEVSHALASYVELTDCCFSPRDQLDAGERRRSTSQSSTQTHPVETQACTRSRPCQTSHPRTLSHPPRRETPRCTPSVSATPLHNNTLCNNLHFLLQIPIILHSLRLPPSICMAMTNKRGRHTAMGLHPPLA